MILEKVYDELYGMIEDLKKKIKAADVDITPVLDSGTKIADFSCDGETGSLYTPTQVNADWNAVEGVAEILNKPTIPADLSQPSGVGTSVSVNPGDTYTASVDGYAEALISGGDNNGYVYVTLKIGNSTLGRMFISKTGTEYSQSNVAYIKKGTTIEVSADSLRAATFYPLTYGNTRTKKSKKED